MKKLTFAISLLLFFGLNIVAQTTEEPEIEYSGPGKVTLLNGDEISGKVYHKLTTSYKIWITDEKGEEHKYTTADVKEFTVNDMHFVRLKKPGLEQFGLLINKPESKIQIIKLTMQKLIGVNGTHTTTVEYYANFVSKEKLMSVDDMGFTNKNLAVLTEDCPELSKAIASKSKDYKLGLMTSPVVKLQILTKISEEYENCK
jgi:hypothetical protein